MKIPTLLNGDTVIHKALKASIFYTSTHAHPFYKDFTLDEGIRTYLDIQKLQNFACAYDKLGNRGEAQANGRKYAKDLKYYLHRINIDTIAPPCYKSDRRDNLYALFGIGDNAPDVNSYYKKLSDLVIFLENVKILYLSAGKPIDYQVRLIELCHFLQNFYLEVTFPKTSEKTHKPMRCLNTTMF